MSNSPQPRLGLTEYGGVYSKTSWILWQYYRDEPALNNNNNIIDFPTNNNNNTSFRFEEQKSGQTGNGGTKDVAVMVPLKDLSNFWKTLEIPLINCEPWLQLKWSKNYILVAGTASKYRT